MKNLVLLFTLFFAFQNVSAQQSCGFDSYLDDMMLKDTAGVSYMKGANARWSQQQAAMLSNGRTISTGYGTEYEIPVVVHIIHSGQSLGTTKNPTDATVQAVIDDLNDVFAASHSNYKDTNNSGVRFPLKFVLAKRTSACGTTTGINRVNGSSLSGYASYGVNRSATGGADDEKVKALSRWDSREYYNIWVVTEIDSNDGTSGSFTAGYAQFPGFTDTTDGTVILAQYFKTNETVLAHEMGHAFYLYHTFQGDNSGASCPTNTSCSTQGDLICDTEPHKRNASTCPSNSATNSCTSTTWGGAHRNFMDYNSCPDRFTDGQRTRFISSLVNDRPGLATSMGGVAPPSTTTTSASCTTTINSSNATNNFNMGPVKVELNDLISNSRGYNLDHYTTYIDRTCTQWAHVYAGQSYTLSVNTETNVQYAQAYIDYSNNGAFVTGERVMNHNSSLSTGASETHTSTVTIPTSGITTCTPLRMRVIADFISSSKVTNGCGQLDYGQAEDFTVYIKKSTDTVTMYNTITSGANPTCTTGSVTFTASASRSLSSPSYQWYRNSQPVGTNSSTYSVSSLSAGTYYVKCKVKYTNGCSVTDSMMTNEIAQVINTSTITPSVSIAANPGNSICSGTSVTFTATPTNGGTSPSYQWKKNNVNVGSNSATYTNASLANGDVIKCVMTSNASCVSSATATSGNITMSVTPNVTPSVNIAANPGTSICSGTSVTFTATPTNGGTPSYQWKLNGGNVGSNSTTYTNSSLSNTDVVSCVMTSTASCASPTTVNSNNLTMTVTANVTPSVVISANPGTSICSSTSVTFTAVPTNGGTPSYQWKLNGSNVGSNSTTYTNASLSNSDVVSCVMTSSITCVTSSTANSNNLTMTVTPSVTQTVSIAANPGTSICTGASVTFTATRTPTAPNTPSHQWKVNGTTVSSGIAGSYTTSTLSNSDVVSCVLTRSVTCATSTTATSNNLTMTVSPNVTPSVSISANPGNSICAGTSVTFTAVPTNGGTPTYQWKLNGSNVGTNSTTYTNASLANSDVVSCVMTSSLSCVTSSTATSGNITMTVTPNVTPSVAISANPGNTICTGTSVTFTAVPTNGGTPTYQWKLNGSNVGTNSTTYTNATLSNSDVVRCVMTSSLTCVTRTSDSSDITMTVNTVSAPAVAISANPGNSICAGTSVTFTAVPTNGGSSPSYQWKLNSGNVGTNSSSYTNASLANSDVISCVMTSNSSCASPATATSSNITMTVTPNVTPSVAISANPGNTICSGTSVTFTAVPTNGGTPSYQWKLNGSNVGTNSTTYTNTTLANSDVITCVMTSSLTCVTSATATSSGITMVVTTTVTPSVAISANPGNSICAGTSVTFTAAPTNGGTPSYQWKLNGSNVGTNSTTYTNATLSTSDAITCVMTSSLTCVTSATATSSGITMTVTPNVTPSVAISANPGNSICASTSVTFTAVPTNGGTPTYQWKLNGSNVGTNSTTYTNATLSNSDVITCVMTSSLTCVTSATATSSGITMTVTPNVTPSVAISANPGNNICSGTSVTFTAVPTNGGTPSYQWKLNGSNVGTNSTTYTNASLANSDVVSCVMTSSITCVTSSTATSNNITMVVGTNLVPSVAIAAVPGNSICSGTSVTFTATPTNGGTPSYQWKLNGSNVGANSVTYTNATLSNADIVSCVMTTSLTCVTATTATSNNITMTVATPVTPSVVIAAVPGNSICAGTSVTFTATPTNGGTPTYQWKLNGGNVGTNSATYTNATLSNADIVSCVMTTSLTCVTAATATSNNITMTVATPVTPSVVIAAVPGNNICAGTSVTFTATPTNGGTPSYQWKLNGSNVGTNSTTYTNAALANSDVISCVMTTSLTCVTAATATSNNITMIVGTNLVPSVAIAAVPGNSICAGTSVTFTATPTNGGTPSYQWKLNGSNVGTNSTTYTNPALVNSDIVSCVMTTSLTCVTTTTATSNNITMTVTTPVTPSVAIAAVPGNSICSGTSVTFTATPTNGGTPTYQWKLNGGNVGTNSATYTNATLVNSDVISCVMTTSLTCITAATATSNNITMTVTTPVTPSVTISANPGNTICAATSVTFTAVPTNGGTPTYQWKLNGTNVGTNSATYTNATLVNSDIVSCVLTTSLTCITAATANSNNITMIVTTPVTPAVSIVAAPGNNICDGTSVTFTATPTNGGTPTYQWKINGTNVGTNNSQYTSTTLANSDVVTCELTTSLTCVTTPTATSNSVTMIVTPNVTPAVSITANPGNVVCNGTSVTFTAVPVNGGTTPIYQWKLNGVNAGANSTTYTNATLTTGDIISCIMLSSETCVTATSATSNNITMTVNPNLTPAVTIAALPSNAICDGANVTFTATPTNGGTTPAYQWKVNGTNVGTNSSTYSSTTLANNDVVTVVLTSSETCVTTATATSTGITMNITLNVTPTVSISASTPTTICATTSVTFTAIPTNEGATPAYQWKVNGTNVGTNNTTYTTTTLSNADVVSCVLTSSITCVTSATANSNNIAMTVNPLLTPTISIAAGPNDTVCAGTTVTFTATPTNGGTTPRYQWKLNNVLTGANSPTYVLTNPSDGDIMSCELTSNATCLTTILANSSNLTLKVNINLTPAVSISVSPNDTICAGNSATFTAVPTNGGTTPAYQWKVNGTNAGTNSSTYTSSTLINTDVVTCVMTSSETCVTTATATSNGITMTVNPNLSPTVTTTVAPNDTICAGTMTTFTAVPFGGGSAPAYQWKLNGANVGANSNTYTSGTLADADVITVVLTSNSTCLATPTGTSTGITMTVNPNLTPDVSIAVSPNDTICTNQTATFTATPVNGGTTPTYQWRVNATNAGTNSNTFATATLASGDIVTCILTSSETCVTRSMDTSNSINIFVRSLTTPSVTVLANTGTTICTGSQVDFSSSFTNGGTAQTYQWRLNGTDIGGATASTYITNTLSTGDILSLKMNITDFCPDPDSAISNSLNMTVVTPSVDVIVAPNDTICDNESAMFSLNTSNVGNQPIYQWTVNGIDMIGAASDVYTMATVSNGDIVTTRFVSSNNCINTSSIAATNSVNMVVNSTAAVVAGITANPSNIFNTGDLIWFSSTTNVPNADYQWFKNGVAIPGATGIIYNELNPLNGDSISLRIQTTDSCRMPNTSMSNVIVLQAATSVKQIEQLFDKVTIVPNPNNGKFILSGTLNINTMSDIVRVDIINTLGAVVYKSDIKVEHGEFKHQVDLGDIADGGLHIARIHANGGVHYVKFVTSNR